MFLAIRALAVPFHSAAIRARHGPHGAGISSVFTLVATLITASVTACPVKSAAVSICAKAHQALSGASQLHSLFFSANELCFTVLGSARPF
jgi:ABC-type enterochelin transport system ATPase subunit